MTIVEFLLARIAEDEATAKAALTVWPSPRWKAETCTAYGWRNGRLGPEPALPFVVSDDEHGSLLLASIWPEDGSSLTDHVVQHDPARVLAECEAKRRLVELCASWAEQGERATGYDLVTAAVKAQGTTAEAVLRALVPPYADHPDFDPAWRS